MNDFDKAINLIEKAQANAFKAYKAISKFNEGLVLTREQEAEMTKALDRIELAHNILEGVVEKCVGLARHFD